MRVPAGRREREIAFEVGQLRLDFLDAKEVGVLLRQPVEQALAGGGADAVGIERDDAQERIPEG
jgi:hypothetical protein